MSTHTTLLLDVAHPTIQVRPTTGGRLQASIINGAGHEAETFTVQGPPEEVVALLTGWARQAADMAVGLLNPETPAYAVAGPIVDGVEVTTSRLACCGAGPDQVDGRTGERLHLPGCTSISAPSAAVAEHLRRQAERQAVA